MQFSETCNCIRNNMCKHWTIEPFSLWQQITCCSTLMAVNQLTHAGSGLIRSSLSGPESVSGLKLKGKIYLKSLDNYIMGLYLRERKVL